MDKLKWLSETFPEILESTEIPILIRDSQCLAEFIQETQENRANWELGIQKTKIKMYDNTICVIRHSPKKNISRLFE